MSSSRIPKQSLIIYVDWLPRAQEHRERVCAADWVNRFSEGKKMVGFGKYLFLARAASNLARIRARTWLILGVAALGVVGLLAWAGITILSWLWGQAPAVTETGKRVAGEAAAQIEQAAPALRDQVEQWAPGLTERLQHWLPGEKPPAHDVSGTDVGPVPRYPGLVRSHFAREGLGVEVAYAGRGEIDAVLAHYLQGFADGYAHEVISATPDAELHRFKRGREVIDLALARRPGGLIEVRLRQMSGQ